MAEKNYVRTPKFRVSFPELFEAKSFQNQTPKFSVQMLFGKKTDLKILEKEVNRAIKEKWGDKPPKRLERPFKDGDEKELEGYENKIVVNASSKFKPIIVNAGREAITDPEEIYAGCYAHASVFAYAWEHKDEKSKAVLKSGVSFTLVGIQKVEDGERFVKRADAAELFEELQDINSESESELDDDDFSDLD